jgi:hypothetical protein
MLGGALFVVLVAASPHLAGAQDRLQTHAMDQLCAPTLGAPLQTQTMDQLRTQIPSSLQTRQQIQTQTHVVTPPGIMQQKQDRDQTRPNIPTPQALGIGKR